MVLGGLGDPNDFRGVPGVMDLRITPSATPGTTRLRIATSEMAELAPRLCMFALEHHWQLIEMFVDRPSLEDLFVEITEEEEASVGV